MALRADTGGGAARRRGGRGMTLLAIAMLLSCADGPAAPSRADTVPVIAAPGRTSTLKPTERLDDVSGNAAVTLELALDKPAVVAGESIPFTITLKNKGPAEITVPQPSSRSAAFSIRVTGGRGFAASGDPSSVAVREGERLEQPRSPRTMTLAAGAATSLRGDVIAWLGDLEPGKYTIAASFEATPSLGAQAKPAEVRVTPAHPVYLRQGGRNAFLARVPRDTAWIHRGSAGYELFLLRASPAAPNVSLSNRAIASLDGPFAAVPASFNAGTLDARVVSWVDGAGVLHAVRVPDAGATPTALTARLPGSGMTIVEPPFVDDGGSLLAVLAGADGKSATLLRLPGTGTALFTPFRLSAPMGAQRAVLWGPDGRITLAWVAEGGGEIHAASARVGSLPAAIEGRKVASVAGRLEDLRLASRSHEADEGYDVLAIALARTGDAMVQMRIDAASGKIEAERRAPATGAAGGKLLGGAVGEDLEARYLVAGSAGAVSVLHTSLAKATAVLDASGKPVRESAFPQLVLASRPGTSVSTWVRFVEGGRKLAVVKVE